MVLDFLKQTLCHSDFCCQLALHAVNDAINTHTATCSAGAAQVKLTIDMPCLSTLCGSQVQWRCHSGSVQQHCGWPHLAGLRADGLLVPVRIRIRTLCLPITSAMELLLSVFRTKNHDMLCDMGCPSTNSCASEQFALAATKAGTNAFVYRYSHVFSNSSLFPHFGLPAICGNDVRRGGGAVHHSFWVYGMNRLLTEYRPTSSWTSHKRPAMSDSDTVGSYCWCGPLDLPCVGASLRVQQHPQHPRVPHPLHAGGATAGQDLRILLDRLRQIRRPQRWYCDLTAPHGDLTASYGDLTASYGDLTASYMG